jgi:ABC-type antimicrobial peptide transport system permease subunit
MLQNYFKIAWRNFVANKGFSTLNILGLATGIAATAIILIWIEYEVSFDKFHEKGDRIFIAYNLDKNTQGEYWAWNTTPKVMASAIQQDYPEVEKTTRVNWPYSALFSYEDKRIKASGNIVDSSFLSVFTFPLLFGRAEQVLMEPNNIVITKSFAAELFGNADPMGKTILLENEYSFTVSGVLEDLPDNSRFAFKYLVPWAFARQTGYDDNYWGNNSTSTYVLLKDGKKLSDFNNKIKHLRKKHEGGEEMETFLYPFSRMHLYGNFEGRNESGGLIDGIRLFAIIAIFVLVIACINFMNLSTARSEKRAKEVGIRKTIGAGRFSLLVQFLGESLLVSFISFLVGIGIIFIMLPWFNNLVGVNLTVDIGNVYYWLAGLGIVLVTGLFAGMYPAFYLSSFQPVFVLKGTFKRVNAVFTPRKVLVVVQFSFAIIFPSLSGFSALVIFSPSLIFCDFSKPFTTEFFSVSFDSTKPIFIMCFSHDGQDESSS